MSAQIHGRGSFRALGAVLSGAVGLRVKRLRVGRSGPLCPTCRLGTSHSDELDPSVALPRMGARQWTDRGTDLTGCADNCILTDA